mmetsp:Transcript_37273/g.94522  ORF Transcript_37273/g.94522 Transcript_37273/m.94522 type:complete len:242 (-) Transcript_37273:856-1581(-)
MRAPFSQQPWASRPRCTRCARACRHLARSRRTLPITTAAVAARPAAGCGWRPSRSGARRSARTAVPAPVCASAGAFRCRHRAACGAWRGAQRAPRSSCRPKRCRWRTRRSNCSTSSTRHGTRSRRRPASTTLPTRSPSGGSTGGGSASCCCCAMRRSCYSWAGRGIGARWTHCASGRSAAAPSGPPSCRGTRRGIYRGSPSGGTARMLPPQRSRPPRWRCLPTLTTRWWSCSSALRRWATR